MTKARRHEHREGIRASTLVVLSVGFIASYFELGPFARTSPAARPPARILERMKGATTSVTTNQSMAIRSAAARVTVLSPATADEQATVCKNVRRNGAMDDLLSDPRGASSGLPHVSSLSDHWSQERGRDCEQSTGNGLEP